MNDNNQSFAPEGPTDPELSEARKLLNEGFLEKARAKISAYWLKKPFDSLAIEMFAEIVNDMGWPEAAQRLVTLAGKLHGSLTPYKNHQEIFEAGYALVDVRQHELASMLLKEVHRELPEDPHINYELGFSLMSLKRFREAKRHFSMAIKVKPDFDSMLNLCVCETLERNIEAARKILADLAPLAQDEHEKEELAHRRMVLTRMETLPAKKKLNARDWLYVLYGAILLRPQAKVSQPNEEMTNVAAMLVVLRGVLSGLSCDYEGMEYYSLRSRPMTTTLSHLLDLPCDAYRGPDRPDQVMLLMSWTTDILGPHSVFIENSIKRALFAYGLSTSEPLPVVPDIIGCLCEDLVMPWEAKEYSDKEIKALTEKLYVRASDLEADPDLLREAQEAVDYYLDKRHLLVLGNPAFKNRPEYTAEMPHQDELAD